MTGYCGTCRVHFSTLKGWAEHQHVLAERADRRVYRRRCEEGVVTTKHSDAYSYVTNPRLAALRHVEAGNELRQNQPEPQPEGPTWPWAW
jgi:uncharacterized protein YraI